MPSSPSPARMSAADGLTLQADVWAGAGRGQVILLHGGGQTRHAWGETGAMLAHLGFAVVSLDMRGHGDSDWDPDARYDVSDYARDLEPVLAAIEGPVVLIGASLGGMASLAYAGGPERKRVRGLVLVDITPRPRLEGVEKILAFMRGHPEGFATLDEAADAVSAYLPNRRRRASSAGLMKNLRARNGRLHWHWDPRFLAERRPSGGADPHSRLEDLARRVEAPTLLVRGTLSEIVSHAEVESLRALIPHAEVIEVEDAAHMVAGDHNTVFGEAVVAFLERLPQ